MAVTLQIPKVNFQMDLDLPWQLPVPVFLEQILPEILRMKGVLLPVPAAYMIRLAKQMYDRTVPILTHTLQAAGIYDGYILLVDVVPRPPWGDPYRFYLEEALEGQESPSGERIYLAQTRIRFGRHDLYHRYVTDVDLSLFPGGQRVSRRHALIQWWKDRFYIYDRGSRNRTYLNQIPLVPKRAYALHPGDCISFTRHLRFIFHDALAQPSTTKQPSC